MKKIISLLVIAALLCAVACFGACSGGKKTAEDQTTAAAPSAAFAGVFSLTADKDAVAPGDTVTVTLRAENCENVACFDVEMTSSENASLTDYK